MGRAPIGIGSLIGFVLALTILPAPLCAQSLPQPWADSEDYPARVDVSVSGGFLMSTRWSDVALLGSISPATGALEQVLTRDVHVKPGTELTAAATYWRGRYGFRAQAGFSRSSLRIGSGPVAGPIGSTSGETASVDSDTWLYDVGGAIGLVDYEPRRSVWPYGFVGVGGITYNLKQTVPPPLTFVERGPSAAGNTIVVVNDGRELLITTNSLSTETVFALKAGVGTEFRVPVGGGGFGLRLEVADHLARSPIALRVEELSARGRFPSDTGTRYRMVHHLSASAGLVVHIGR